jgi:hypothetical protein
MAVEVCEVPVASRLDAQLVKDAYFKDSYSAPLANGHSRPVEQLFFALFGHLPRGVKRLLIIRNAVAGWCGLEVPSAAEIMAPQVKARYAVGDKIGPWPIFDMTASELIAGRDNPHLNFRLSVMKVTTGEAPRVCVSTICSVNHWSGKLYLFFIVPFHKWGVQRLMANAVAAGRL